MASTGEEVRTTSYACDLCEAASTGTGLSVNGCWFDLCPPCRELPVLAKLIAKAVASIPSAQLQLQRDAAQDICVGGLGIGIGKTIIG